MEDHKWITVYSNSPEEMETCRICGWWKRADGKYALPKTKRGWLALDFEPSCINANKEVPKQYKKNIDKLICDIGDSINSLRPYIMELGESLELENDNFKVEIFLKPKEAPNEERYA